MFTSCKHMCLTLALPISWPPSPFAVRSRVWLLNISHPVKCWWQKAAWFLQKWILISHFSSLAWNSRIWCNLISAAVLHINLHIICLRRLNPFGIWSAIYVAEKIQELQSVPCYHQISSFTFRCKFWPQNIFTGNTNSQQEDKCQISQVFTAEVVISKSFGGWGPPLEMKLFEQTCLSVLFSAPHTLRKQRKLRGADWGSAADAGS